MFASGQTAFAQLDSIFDQSTWRKFIVHLPNTYSASKQYPLVINLHGLNSSAAQQQSYSQFDTEADVHKFIVVYPNAIAGSWNINGSSDVDFIASLIDTIRNTYSCNTCLFITGMSQGGFLTYKLACSLSKPIKALAVVSGNMSQNLQNTCTVAGGPPIAHFHGTADPLVNYNGTVGIPPVLTTINWWVTKNNSSSSPVYNALTNTNLADSSTVEKYYYAAGPNGSETTFYKIIKGGHTWPGAAPVPPFGFTNLDINASQLIGTFFSQYCSLATGVSEITTQAASVYPNPFSNRIHVKNFDELGTFELLNSNGQVVSKGKDIEEIDFTYLSNGLYFLKLAEAFEQHTYKLIKN